jgi:hypothetical protein
VCQICFTNFQKGDVYGDLNKAMVQVNLEPIMWLPRVGEAPSSTVMTEFISKTSEMHREFMERLGGVKFETQEELEPISLMGVKAVSYDNAMLSLEDVFPKLEELMFEAKDFAGSCALAVASLTVDHIAALHTYTQAGEFYRSLNAALRNSNRQLIAPYLSYLRLFFDAASVLFKHQKGSPPTLYRGVAADLKSLYGRGKQGIR